ncbi:hypothetical protein R6Q57_023892 [Mikania cordata]
MVVVWCGPVAVGRDAPEDKGCGGAGVLRWCSPVEVTGKPPETIVNRRLSEETAYFEGSRFDLLDFERLRIQPVEFSGQWCCIVSECFGPYYERKFDTGDDPRNNPDPEWDPD